MAQSNYDESLRRLLRHEGGYSNHPSDPGGPTNFGITIADYRRYVKPDATAADVRAMALDEAKLIYRERYWNTQRCDELPPGVDYAIFDYGVNSGIGRSGKVLRRVLNLADGSHAVTDGVIAAARSRKAAELVAAICDERLAFLKRLKTWPVFGAGWGRRVAEVRAAALAMTKAKAAAAGKPKPAGGKGAVRPGRGIQNTVAGGIVVAGGAAAQEAHRAGLRPAIVVAFAVIAIAAAAAFWLWWRTRKHHQQES